MNKRYIMFGFATVALAVLALGAWWWQGEGQYRNIEFVPGDPEFSSNQEYFRYYEALKEAYAEDKYGGDTPEETLQLFIDALKAGDVELASKYFVVEKQKEIAGELTIGKENNNLDFLVGFLEEPKTISERVSSNEHEFTVTENNKAIMSFNLVLNQETGRWKMYEL